MSDSIYRDIFTIMLDPEKLELRVVRFDALEKAGHPRLFEVPDLYGGWRPYVLPPGVENRSELPLFETAEAAWESIRKDFCPSLHP